MYRLTERKPVQQGLSYTPSMMNKMREQGIPISANSLPSELFEDGDTSNNYEVPLYRQRGIDVADVWEAEQTARKKIRDYQTQKTIEL